MQVAGKVEDQTINDLNEQRIHIDCNHNFWTFRDVYETNKTTMPFLGLAVESNTLVVGSNHDERRHIISVFNTVELLNRHASLYLNYLKLLVESKSHVVCRRSGTTGEGCVHE